MDTSSHRSVFLLLSVIAAITIGGIFSGYILAGWKGVIGLIAPGRSDVRVYLLLGYLLVLYAGWLFSQRLSSARVSLLAVRIFVTSVILLLLLNFTSFLLFSYHLGQPLGAYTITIAHGEFSSSQLLHNHLLKGAVGLFARALGGGVFPNLDLGTAYLGLIPTRIFLLAGLLFLIASVSAIVGVGVLARSGVVRVHLGSQLIVYGLSSFALLRATLDGGLFDFVVLPAFLALGSLIYSRRCLMIASAGYLGALALLAVIPGGIVPVQLFVFGYKVFLAASFFASIGLLGYSWQYFRNRFLAPVFLGAVLCLGWYAGTIKWFRNEITALSSGAFVASSRDLPSVDYRRLAGIGDVQLYRYISTSTRRTVNDLITATGDLPSFEPVVVPGRDCLPLDRAARYDFDLLSSEPIALEDRFPLHVEEFQALESQRELFRYRVALSSNGCVPRPLAFIQEFIEERSRTPYFITNLSINHYDLVRH